MAKTTDFRRVVSAYANDGHRRLDQLVEQAEEYYSAQEKAAAASRLELAAEEARDFKWGAAIRDLFIQVYFHCDTKLSDREICGKLDNDLAWGATTVGLPPAWIQEYGIQTFEDAYDHAELKNSVQAIIAKAKKKPIRIAGLEITLSMLR